MPSWNEEEIALAKQIIEVPVEDLGFKDNGKTVKVIPVKDLSNTEMMVLQSDPLLNDYPGTLGVELTPKAQVFGLLVTYRRMKKANPSLPFTETDMLKWGSTRTGALVKRISEHLGNIQKKIENLEKVEKASSSETPSSTRT